MVYYLFGSEHTLEPHEFYRFVEEETMKADDYQDEAMSLENKDLSDRDRLITYALGLCGEAGEVADIIKKHIGQGNPLTPELIKKLRDEVADCQWYVARLAKWLGIPLSKLMGLNLEKLHERYPDGFSPEASMNRSENAG